MQGGNNYHQWEGSISRVFPRPHPGCTRGTAPPNPAVGQIDWRRVVAAACLPRCCRVSVRRRVDANPSCVRRLQSVFLQPHYWFPFRPPIRAFVPNVREIDVRRPSTNRVVRATRASPWPIVHAGAPRPIQFDGASNPNSLDRPNCRPVPADLHPQTAGQACHRRSAGPNREHWALPTYFCQPCLHPTASLAACPCPNRLNPKVFRRPPCRPIFLRPHQCRSRWIAWQRCRSVFLKRSDRRVLYLFCPRLFPQPPSHLRRLAHACRRRLRLFCSTVDRRRPRLRRNGRPPSRSANRTVWGLCPAISLCRLSLPPVRRRHGPAFSPGPYCHLAALYRPIACRSLCPPPA